jgi:hypothetical protein
MCISLGDMINLSNKKFGRLTAVRPVGKTSQGTYIWECLCVCGKTKNIRGYHLTGEKTRSCGCLTRQNANIKWEGSGEVPRWLWNNYRISAIKRKIEFNLTAKQMWDLVLNQNKKCALSGEDLTFNIDPIKRNQTNASLDRIDSKKGYIVGNLQWVTKEINFAKHGLNQQKFLDLCLKVVQNQKIRI